MPALSSVTTDTCVSWICLVSVMRVLSTPSASPRRFVLRTTREVCTPDPISRVAYSATNCVTAFNSASDFIFPNFTGAKIVKSFLNNC